MPKEDTQFKVGQSGNPNGRPKGSRSKLSEAYLKALADDFSEHGVATIESLRTDRPDVYIGAIGKLMPKLMELSGKDGAPIDVKAEWSVLPVTPLSDDPENSES